MHWMVSFILLIFYSTKDLDNTARYICLSCRPGVYHQNGYCDFCYKCFDNIRKGNEEGKRIEQIDQASYDSLTDLGFKCKVEKKHSRDHVYLCLICGCNNFGYKDY